MSVVVNAGVSVVSVDCEFEDGTDDEVTHIAIFPNGSMVDVSQLSAAKFTLMEPEDARAIAAALIFAADHVAKVV